MAREARLLIAMWIGLLVLLSATVATTFSPLPPVLKPLINLLIAGAKAGLILWVYMHVREQPGLNRIVAVGAAAWLVVLISMTLIDIALAPCRCKRARARDASFARPCGEGAGCARQV